MQLSGDRYCVAAALLSPPLPKEEGKHVKNIISRSEKKTPCSYSTSVFSADYIRLNLLESVFE